MKMIKTVLSVTAILFAVLAAFATNTSPDNLAKREVSIRGGLCENDGYCTDGGASICTFQNNGTTFLDVINPGPVCSPWIGLGTWSAN
jgi:hypothetical protein